MKPSRVKVVAVVEAVVAVVEAVAVVVEAVAVAVAVETGIDLGVTVRSAKQRSCPARERGRWKKRPVEAARRSGYGGSLIKCVDQVC